MAENDADDVLDFINSLPDSGTNAPAAGNENKSGKSEDFLEFLDELAAHDTKKPPSSTPTFEPKKNDKVKQQVEVEKIDKNSGINTTSDDTEVTASTSTKETETETEPETESNEIDPIGQLSSWWSSEGSKKASTLWGTFTTNAQQITDSTYKLASETSHQISQQRQKIIQENSDSLNQLDGLTGKLNSALYNFTNQIKDGLIGPDDELLNILLVHDLENVNYLDTDCSTKFNEVVRQVEGGIRVSVNNFHHKDQNSGQADGVKLNLFHGKAIDGEKLCFANLESSIKSFAKINHPITKKDSEVTDETKESEPIDDDVENTVNTSNVLISIQPITTKSNNDEVEPKDFNSPIMIDSNNKDSFSFTLILKDVSNNITIITKTQPFPIQWADWLSGESNLDEDNVNPSQWVSGWIRDGLALSFGVLAQQYVVKRMGY